MQLYLWHDEGLLVTHLHGYPYKKFYNSYIQHAISLGACTWINKIKNEFWHIIKESLVFK